MFTQTHFQPGRNALRMGVGLLTAAIAGFVFELVRDAIHDGDGLGWTASIIGKEIDYVGGFVGTSISECVVRP